jgi:hypothetical protein
MRILIFIVTICHLTFTSSGQKARIDVTVNKDILKSHLSFIASDELKGRGAGSNEEKIAARYIAEQFRKYGIQSFSNNGDYLQRYQWASTQYSTLSQLKIGNKKLEWGSQFVVRNGTEGDFSGNHLFLESIDSIDGKDLRNAIVVTQFFVRYDKANIRTALKEKGCKAWIEILGSGQGFYSRMRELYAGKIYSISTKWQNELPHFAVNDPSDFFLKKLKVNNSVPIKVSVKKTSEKSISSANVVGKIEGADSILKNEHVVLSAHYDHIGTFNVANLKDSIYNGARDNAIGTTALITAGEYFARNPSKRSIILIGFSTEEIGGFGAQYYVENPVVSLKDCVFNLNIDNAGYNDTEKVTIVGSGKTNIDSLVTRSALSYGLIAIPDPMPQENFIERSDQINFMREGVPAIVYSMGMTAMDDEMKKYYHQANDDVDSLDMNYVYKYICSYILTVENLLNSNFRPYWNKGDSYEKVGNLLYSH